MPEQDSKPYGSVYLITNTVNGKQYVGQTVVSIEKRWAQHCYKASKCKAMYAAIIKYGKAAFSIENLAVASSADELNRLEAHYVDFYRSVSPDGYNLKDGGGSKGKWSEEIRRSISDKANTPQRIAKASVASVDMWKRDDVRKRISDAIRVGLSKPEVRKNRSDIAKISCNTKEVKARMSAAQKIRFSDPVQREVIGTRQRELQKDPDYRERIRLATSKAKSQPAYREKVSDNLRSLWENVEYREKMVAAQKARRAREKLLRESQQN